MTTTLTRPAPERTTIFARPALGRVTAAWCAGFGLVHGYWALGGRVGVPAAVPDIATRPVFLAYDVLAGVGLVVAALLALGVATGRVPARRVVAVRRGATGAGVVLVLRGVVGIGQDLVAVATNGPVGVGGAYDAWFVVAGLLFLALAARVRR